MEDKSMFCGKCGYQARDGITFCPKCGNDFTKKEAPLGGQGNSFGGGNRGMSTPGMGMGNPGMGNSGIPPMPMSSDPGPTPNGFSNAGGKQVDNPYSKAFDKNVDYIASTGARGFVSEDEVALYSLNNGNIAHMVAGRGWVSDDAVLTDKRLYYTCNTGFITKTRDEQIVDLEDITGTKIRDHSPLGYLILAVLFFLGGIIAGTAERDLEPLIFIGIILAIVMVIIYWLKKDAILSIEYAGGFIDFRVKYYGMDKIRAFQRCIYAAKESTKVK